MGHKNQNHSKPEGVPTGTLRARLQWRTYTSATLPQYVQTSKLLSLRGLNVSLLKASEKHFRSFFSRNDRRAMAVFVAESSGVILDCFGDPVTLSELAAQGFYPGLITNEDSCGDNVIDLTVRHQKSVQLLGRDHNGSMWKQWHWASSPILLDNGKLVGVCAVAVSDAGQLPVSKTLIESGSIAISSWMSLEEDKQNITRIHHTMISQLDYHVFFVNARNTLVDERHPIPVGEVTRSEMRNIVSSGVPIQKEVLIDNCIYMVDVRKLTDYRGQCKGTLALFRDVSEQKRWETQLRDMEKMSALTSLAAGIAHEIRNPLTAAKGFLQLFIERVQNGDDQRFLDLTLAELDRINALVKDFMSMARPKAPQYTNINLRTVVRDLIHFVQPQSALYGVVFEAHLPDEPLRTWADANQIKQVLLNIVQNALQACMESGGTVELTLRREDHHAIITVQDTGVGMDERQIQKIFQPFYTTKDTGTGLGLAISRRIIEEHAGTIDVESMPNHGTTVTITFQCTQM